MLRGPSELLHVHSPRSELLAQLTNAIVSIVYGDAIYPRAGTLGPRVQDDILLVIVHRGSATIAVDDDRLDVGPDTASLMLPGRREHYRFSSRETTHHGWIHFRVGGNDVDAILERCTQLPPTLPLPTTMARDMRMLTDLASDPTPRRQELAVLTASRMLFDYIGTAELREGTASPPPAPLERALGYIERHLDRPLELADVAGAAAVSRPHLIRLFQQHLGTTPVRYLWRRRDERGTCLLQKTDLSVAEIAERSGFRTGHHFSRRIHAATGLTPTQVRTRARRGRSLEA